MTQTLSAWSTAVVMPALALTLAFSPPGFASGSDSFSTTSNATGRYNAGKRVFSEKLACDACMFAGKSIDKETAQKIVNDPQATKALSAEEKETVVAYAKKRFGL
jgi:hypothetical protein